ncbi:uncharacterized protein LOC144883621 [Branchiostoma floridae x Branchiostoma japonicum]
MGEHEAALAAFEDALGIINHFPNKPRSAVNIHWLRGEYCFDTGNFQKAIQDFTQVINLDKEGTYRFTQDCYELKVDAYLQLGQPEQAIATAIQYSIHYPWVNMPLFYNHAI